MKLTIEQKQEVYEKLLELGCCDLLAALIAERSDSDVGKFAVHDVTLSNFISGGFFWDDSLEGQEFWHYMYECVEELEEDFLPYDTEPDKTKDTINIEVIPPVNYSLGDTVQYEGGKLVCIGVSSITKPLTWFEKVKLFFGRLFYKV